MLRYQVILKNDDLWGGSYLRYRSVAGFHSLDVANRMAKSIGAFCVFDALENAIARG